MYDSENVTRYDFGNLDLGGGSDFTRKIRGPKGKTGRLVDMGVYGVTEAFNGGTLNPAMKLGTLSDDDYYVENYNLGAVAINDGGKSIKTVWASPVDAGYSTYVKHKEIAADSVVVATFLAATGSGLTGMANCYVDIVWDK